MAQWKRLGRDAAHPAGIARYLVTSTGEVVVWCDGTRTRQEWRWNAMVLRRRYGSVRASRVDWEQALAVVEELRAVGIGEEDEVDCAGYSRGGAIGWLVAYMLGGTSLAFAGKRTGDRALVAATPQLNFSHRGDVVPLLPPWYAKPAMAWVPPWLWPWAAHLWSAQVAAQWRHTMSQA